MTEFAQLGLAEPLLRALTAKGYENATPIQVQAIPPLLEGRDLCGIAQTGTGKTAAFALPMLDRLLREPADVPHGAPRALVLAPTRELAAQIAVSANAYGRFAHLKAEAMFGGVPIGRQIARLRNPIDILVATPGRLIDLVDQRVLSLAHVEIFVLDEADQMMDMGFVKPVERIARMLPKKRQSVMFSATMPDSVRGLRARFIHDPVEVSVAPQSRPAERVEQRVTFVNQREKQALLTLSLADPSIERALVFTRTRHGADRVVRYLSGAGIGTVAIHGDKSQGQRTAALQSFRAGTTPILVATDIAARGIDIPGVSHVFNFELPEVPEQYVHRIGRTARAGAEGIAISFVNEDERPLLRAIERATGVRCEIIPLPDNFLESAQKLPAPAPVRKGPKGQPPRGNGAGPRRSGKGSGGGGGSGGSGGGSGRNAAVGQHKDAVRPARGRSPKRG